MRTTKLNYWRRPSSQSARVLKCKSCHRRYRHGGADAHLWNVEFAHGIPLRLLCPECQTEMQSLEAEVNAAMLSYGVDAQGRFHGYAKGQK